MVLCATLVRELGARCVPHLPVLVPQLIEALEASTGTRQVAGPAPSKEDIVLAATWFESIGRALVVSLPQFLSPHLPRLLRALLGAAEVPYTHGAELATAARGLQQALAETLPTRLLVPPLLEAAGTAAQLGPAAAVTLLGTLSRNLAARPQAEVQALHRQAFQLLLTLVDHRLTRCGLGAPGGGEAPSPADVRAAARAVEAALSDAFAQLTIQLTEQQFRPLFLRLLAWAFPPAADAGNGGGGAAAGGGGAVAPLHAAHALSFFRVIAGAQAKLCGLFGAYFALALPHARRALVAPAAAAAAADTAAAAAAPEKKRKKRPRLSEPAGGGAPCSATDAALLRAALHFVTLGLRHDGRKAAPIAEIHELEGALLSRLGWPLAPDGELARAVRARAEPVLLDAVAQLAAVLGVDGCKQLHYELCVASRAEATPRRLAALRALSRLYGALKDSGLSHVPEAVPFVAELVEDGDMDVRQEALALMRALEQLTGDTLLQ